MKTQYVFIGEDHIMATQKMKDGTTINSLFKVIHQTSKDGYHSHCFSKESVFVTMGGVTFEGVIENGIAKRFVVKGYDYELDSFKQRQLVDIVSYRRGKSVIEGMAKLMRKVENIPEPQYEADLWR